MLQVELQLQVCYPQVKVNKEISLLTNEIALARKMLRSLHLNGEPAINYFHALEFGTFSKKNHIKSAMSSLDQEIDLKHVILFDDELRNRDVETLGVQFAHIFDEDRGLTKQIFKSAIVKYNNRLPS